MTDGVSPVAKAKDEWLESASAQTGFTVQRVIELLKERFTGFSTDNMPAMMAFLMEKRDEEMTRLEQKIEEEAAPPQLPKCPICGEDAIPDSRWNGRYTKTPGWCCKVGGLDHFLKAKANTICRLQGLPILFKEKDEKLDASRDTESEEDTRAISSG